MMGCDTNTWHHTSYQVGLAGLNPNLIRDKPDLKRFNGGETKSQFVKPRSSYTDVR